MPSEDAVIFTHGHCFDGLCSAALFSRLLKHVEGRPLALRFQSAIYGPEQNGVLEAKLTGPINAILDYRYTRSDKLTWYFDHHRTAFAMPEDRAAFDAHADGRFFFDPNRPSCTGYIAHISETVFDLPSEPIAEIVKYADMIDAAAFPSAQWAVDSLDPVMRLATVVEHAGDSSFITKMVPRLLGEPLAAIAAAEEIQKAWAPLGARVSTFVEKVKKNATPRGKIVLVDLGSESVEIASKFAPYALFPECAYSIVVTRQAGRCKISVGYNPWSPHPREHDISAICKKHGGGGHAVVGAVTIGDDVAKARKIALEIQAELSIPEQ
jgi:hypothetical protein